MSIAYPLIPLAYVLMNVWVFVFFVRERRWEALWSLLTALAGVLIYHFYIRHRPAASGS